MAPPSRLSTRSQLVLLTVVLLAVAAGLLAYIAHAPAPRQPLHLSVLTIAILFAAGEGVRLHIQVRHNTQSVTLTDVVVIAALFTVAAPHVVLLRVAGGTVVAVWLYRRSLMRIVVNVGIMAAESALACAVFTAIARPDATSTRAWAGVLVAAPASGLLSALAVLVAIEITSERQTMRAVVKGLTMGGIVSVFAGTIGLVCAFVAATSRHGWWLVLVIALVGLVVYRGYGRLLERQLALEAVHTFGRMIDEKHDPMAMLNVILRQVPDLVNAARVELVLLSDDVMTCSRLRDDALTVEPAGRGYGPLRDLLEAGRPRLLRHHEDWLSARRLIRGEKAKAAMVAPLPSSSTVVGALIATDRLGRVRGFRRRDLLLFETLARHAGAAMSRVELVQQLRYDVEHDRPTGLLNRQGLEAALSDINDSRAAVLLLRLTGLQEVNDALGHVSGERLLCAAAQRIRAHLRETTPVGRLDGNVFAVLLSEADVDEVDAVGGRLLDIVTQPVELDHVPLALEAKAGVAVGVASSGLIRQAEIALQATQRGGGTIAYYDSAMEPPSVRRLSIAAELRSVLADNELAQQVVLFYQPQADLITGRVESVEALARWQHPQDGLVPPGEFIPVVESTDLVRPLTLHVLNCALADAARWAQQGRPLNVAVNLSARSLYDPRLVGDVAKLLSTHAIAPETLTLEITESAVMDDAERARDVLEDLADLGVTLSVDDFGTGYSSLAYLARLPVSEVKVDRTFVSRMTSDTKDAAVVRSVIDLGHNLDLRVVAEGVEDRLCWDALAESGADFAQGFLLGRPMHVDALEQWLLDHDAELQRSRRAHLRVAT